MSEVAIAVRGVSKRYRVFPTPRARLAHALFDRGSAQAGDIWALRDVGFELRRGDTLAVIGRNGGGKSTLLQILTGTMAPTSGSVEVRGRVSALLELGSGFNPEYTGRDNVVMNGLLLGLERAEIMRRFDEVVAFAEIGEAIDRAVKTYSSGMMMRLAFAVQVMTDPNILVIDEALSVGDFFFQQKCFGHIRALRARGVTLVFVSHDMQTVRDLCDKGLFLKDGRVDYFGDNLEAIRRYLSQGDGPVDTRAARGEEAPRGGAAVAVDHPLWTRPGGEAPHGAKGGLLAVGVYDTAGKPVVATRIGEPLVFRVHLRALCDEPLHVSLVFKNKYDQVVTVVGSYTLRAAPPSLVRGQEAVFEARVNPMIEAGNYSFSVVLGQATRVGEAGVVVDETPLLGPLQVLWDYHRDIPPFFGLVGLEASARFVPAQAPLAAQDAA